MGVMIPVSLHVHVENGQKRLLLCNHLDVWLTMLVGQFKLVLLFVLLRPPVLPPRIQSVLTVLMVLMLLVCGPNVPLLLLVELNSHAGPVSKSLQLLQPQIVPVLLVPMVLMLLLMETVANVPLFPVLPLSPVPPMLIV